VHEEAPQLDIAHSIRYTPVRKEVVGFKMDPTAHHYFTKVDQVE
jgi:dipeptide transport system substrate-binding protein